MRYVVPVNAPDEVPALAGEGAGELYCGFQDAWWAEHYGDHDSATRRQGRANLATTAELAAAAGEARRHGLPLYLALNSRYTEPQLDHLVTLCDAFEAMGGTGIILSDLGLLWRLHGRTGLRVCLSLLAVAQNVPTLEAFRSLGVSRVVLPRFVGWQEAGALLGAVPGMEGEVMAFFDKCPWVDGYCRHRHGVTYPDRDGAGSIDNAPPLFTFDTTYRTHACLGRACTYLQPYPCAACHLRLFEAAGVGLAKLGGRGRPLDERLRALRFLRTAADLGSDDERASLYRSTFGQDCACYYGRSGQNRRAIEPVVAARDASRRYVGSETDFDAFHDAMVRLCQDPPASTAGDLTMLVPPLSESGLRWLLDRLPELSASCPFGTHLAVNDLGTLVEATYAARDRSLGLRVTMGTLLARLDDPAEVAHFLSADENPSRAVWGPAGEPRVLTYREPPEALRRHWATPSLVEPSAQEALRELTGKPSIPYEFG